MQKIGYIALDILPKNNAAAVRNSFFIDTLIENNYNVTVFSSISNKHYKTINSFFQLGSNKDSNFIRLIKELIVGIDLFFQIVFSKKQDTYIISSPPFFTIILTFFAAYIKNKNNIILDIRDIYPEVLFENKVLNKHSFIGKFLKKITLFMYKNSKKIIGVTKGLNQLILNHGIDPQKVFLITNGYDENIFKPSNEKFTDFSLIFHGTLGKFQNIQLLKELIEYCEKYKKDLKFIVIGKGSQEHLIKNLKCNNLKYYEKVPYSEITNIISKCHIGLSFRTDDTIGTTALPVKVFEYIGTALPIIVTPPSEIGEIIERYKIGIQTNNNITEVINAIDIIKNDYPSYIEHLLHVKKEFSRQVQSQKLLDII